MLTVEQVRETVALIRYKDWKLIFDWDDSGPYMQWILETDEGTQYCRKWLIPKEMSKSELVSTAFKAAITAEEHEARESFTYKGKKIFSPHFDVDALAEIAGKKANLDIGTPFNV